MYFLSIFLCAFVLVYMHWTAGTDTLLTLLVKNTSRSSCIFYKWFITKSDIYFLNRRKAGSNNLDDPSIWEFNTCWSETGRIQKHIFTCFKCEIRQLALMREKMLEKHSRLCLSPHSRGPVILWVSRHTQVAQTSYRKQLTALCGSGTGNTSWLFNICAWILNSLIKKKEN